MITGERLRDLIVAQGVEVLDRGHSVSRGNFNIRCPMCGASDQGHHMGIRLDNGWWGCWRNSQHRGKSPVRLLVALTGKPVWQVRDMLGLHSGPLLETFSSVKARLLQRPVDVEAAPQADHIAHNKEFRRLRRGGLSADRFITYLEGRGFPSATLDAVARDFDLRYAVTGDFANRIVMPYTYKDKVVTWTARDVRPDAKLRYRDLEQESSAIHKDELLYNYDAAAFGGKALLVLEGPVDVIKGDWAGRVHGVRCVGLSTNSITDAQVLMLAELCEVFEHTYIGMDTPTAFARMDSYRLASRLRGLVDVEPMDASSLGKDMGGASLRAVSQLLERLVS